MSLTKWCNGCKQSLTREAFWRNRSHGDGLHSRCKICMRAYSAGYYQRNKEKWRGYLLADFGLTPEDFDEMLRRQSGRCGICARPMVDPCVDHDHACCADSKRSCGRCVRGLLCKTCNSGLGQLGEANLEHALSYLRSA